MKNNIAKALSNRCSSYCWKRSIGRNYSSAMAMSLSYMEDESDFKSWELPLPILQDMTSGQKTGRGPQWVFLGSPGVGKSTYATRLAKILNVPHISMGSLLHKEASKSTTFGMEVVYLSLCMYVYVSMYICMNPWLYMNACMCVYVDSELQIRDNILMKMYNVPASCELYLTCDRLLCRCIMCTCMYVCSEMYVPFYGDA